LFALALASLNSFAGTKEQAFRIHNRLASVPPSPAILLQMENLIKSGSSKEAALVAMENTNFYDITLKNWAKKWTNKDQTSRVPLNDYAATVIGIVRDNIPFDQILYGDHLYIAAANTPVTIPPYDKKNNNHYIELEKKFVSLKTYLTRVDQSSITGIPDTAGVLTTRAAGEAFLSAGTNRRMNRFVFMNFLCRDYEAVHDLNISDYHVRQDVERNPGSDSRTYKNQCVGCHAGQDAIGGAWAYFDFVTDQVVYTPGTVVAKINKNVLYKDGWKTENDEWINTWAEGQNANLGWPAKTNGKGAKELGMMISRSRAFAECMSQRSFELVCMRTPKIDFEKKEIKRLADLFQANDNFNMRNLLAETSILCMGE
jgi:hypothetical protein